MRALGYFATSRAWRPWSIAWAGFAIDLSGSRSKTRAAPSTPSSSARWSSTSCSRWRPRSRTQHWRAKNRGARIHDATFPSATIRNISSTRSPFELIDSHRDWNTATFESQISNHKRARIRRGVRLAEKTITIQATRFDPDKDAKPHLQSYVIPFVDE